MADAAPPAAAASEILAKTPLYDLHVELGARMVPFAGYLMPVQYPAGILAEHLATRQSAGLFDVSHMGQALLEGPGAARALERLVPADIAGLAPGATRYTQFLNADAGILDDLMVTRLDDERLFLIVNAAVKNRDFALLGAGAPGHELKILEDRALLALQGPQAEAVLSAALPGVEKLVFMTKADFVHAGQTLHVWRSGYTGEDGYEISLPAALAGPFARRLLADPRVSPVGLGARDSLRLEAGLCLYGHDIDETTNPLEAALMWSIARSRRIEGGFTGAPALAQAIAAGPARKRVGIALEGRAPAREGAEIALPDGTVVGRITSGGFSPTLGRPIAMGYVAAPYAREGEKLAAIVRGKPLPATVVKTPFTPHRYRRG